jgi:hypothetical protein
VFPRSVIGRKIIGPISEAKPKRWAVFIVQFNEFTYNSKLQQTFLFFEIKLDSRPKETIKDFFCFNKKLGKATVFTLKIN